MQNPVHQNQELIVLRSGSNEVKLDQVGILWNGAHYPYSAVLHLKRFARTTEVWYIPLGSYVRIEIELLGAPHSLVLKNVFGLIGSTKNLEKAYSLLRFHSFSQRVAFYLDQFKREGFFEYGGVRLDNAGRAHRGQNSVSLTEAKLEYSPFDLVIHGKSFYARVDCQTDLDAFFYLLDQLYGISFT